MVSTGYVTGRRPLIRSRSVLSVLFGRGQHQPPSALPAAPTRARCQGPNCHRPAGTEAWTVRPPELNGNPIRLCSYRCWSRWFDHRAGVGAFAGVDGDRTGTVCARDESWS